MIKCRFHLVGLFYSTIIGLVWRLSKSAFLCGGFGRRTFYFGQVTMIQKKEKIIYEAKYPRKDYTTDPFFQKACRNAQNTFSPRDALATKACAKGHRRLS